jgi:type IV secretion system protein VirB9
MNFTYYSLNIALAVRESRPISTDSRLRVMVYSPDEVFKFIGYYNYQASIEMAKDEEVVNISMGDSTGWQIVPSGNRIFLKPIEQEAQTNMTLITNKRTYFFELYAEEAKNMRDPDMVFSVKFLYPDADNNNSEIRHYATVGDGGMPDLSHPEKYNFNYTITGNNEIAPIKIFDDGEFTYLQFRNMNAEMPAIFGVDDDLKEYVINYRILEEKLPTVVIEKVYKKLTLRSSKKITCVFNEAILSN